MAKKKTGRKRKLEKPGPRAKILSLIAKSRTLKSACAAVGVCYPTMLAECERDPEFNEQVERAKSARIGLLEDLVHEVAKTDPPTLRWLLANLDRENYAQRPEPQTQNNVNVNVIADPDAIKSRLAALASELGIEDVVETVRIEKANGHHKSNGHGSRPTEA